MLTKSASLSLMVLAVFVLAKATPAQMPAVIQEMQTSVSVDLLSQVSLDDSDQNRTNVREAEMLFYSPIDHLFDGMLNIAAHKEGGEYVFEIHEAYIGSSKLVPRTSFKIGKFLLGVGRLNQVHRHDWPFTEAPKSHREFFADESASDTGAELRFLLPTRRYMDLTVGVTDGYCYGHCHVEGDRPKRPLFYLRPSVFFDQGGGSGILMGLNFLSRKNHTGVQTDLFGFDLVHKVREGRNLKWKNQFEVFYENQSSSSLATQERLGAYFYTQRGLTENLSAGLRLDAFTDLSRKFESNGESRDNFDYGLVPQLTYASSEFSKIRFSYSHEIETLKGVSDIKNREFLLQFVFFLGAHPAHDF